MDGCGNTPSQNPEHTGMYKLTTNSKVQSQSCPFLDCLLTLFWNVYEFSVKDKLRMVLNTLPLAWIEEPNNVPLKMKRFYDSCMAVDYIDADGEKELLRIIKILG